MCWKDYRGRVTKGTSLWIGLSAYNKMYFVELGEKKKPRLTWSVTAGYKYKVGKYWNGREVSSHFLLQYWTQIMLIFLKCTFITDT